MTNSEVCVDPYQLLDIAPDATDKQVRTAYRRAARRAHPDMGGDPENFRRIAAAYRLLTDPPPTGDHEPPPPQVPPAPPGLWRRTAQWPPVQAAAGAVFLSLKLVVTGPIGAVAGIWLALSLLAPAAVMWAACTAVAAVRHRAQLRRPSWSQLARQLRPARLAAALAAAMLLAISVPVSVETSMLLGRGALALAGWIAR